MQNKNKKWLYLLVLSLIWGTSFILIKKSLIGLTPYQLGALRIIITGFFLLVAGYKGLKTIEKYKWKWIIISGFLGSFFPSFFFAIAETEIDSAVVSVLNSLTPLNTILLGLALFNITTTKRQTIGVIIGFIGTAMLILKGSELNPNQNYIFAGFVIGSTFMYATNVNIIKRYLQGIKPLTIAAGNFVPLILPALIVLIATGFFKTETLANSNLKWSLIYVSILSLFGTALAKVLFNKLIQISTPVFASSVTYIMPIVALIWGVLDGELFSGYQAAASVIILLGVYLANKK